MANVKDLLVNGDARVVGNLYAQSLINTIYPVGSIYMSTVSTNPNTLFGVGSWSRIGEGRCLIDCGSTYGAGGTGGSSTHTITVNEMPSHNHSASTNSTGGATATTNENGGHQHFSFNTGTGTPYTYVTATQYPNRAAQNGATAERYTITGSSAEATIGLTSTSGKHTHTVTVSNHSHTVTVNSSGSGSAMNIMNPYLAVYIWKRTA